ncbi:unnamed protein product [Didymodactylos carnosus]|uniref:Chromo domain-containing protein n=1 Tax=Didymodactylos carnosus TaxID=1234261 RepID=A0A813Z1P5_9BILA|nr:unnamed protein product [Didymodactylos carnosus]CAF1009881.1 unnamed protein product [Didymodactylos carnosus]CAF3676968.1 unnamed protein product [Didymodactylos carnosus]CAF3778724.1 unnamed protein product [Didymodactylos carnosus]
MPDEKEAPIYTAERVVAKRIKNGETQYFLKWKGWGKKWNTWEPEKHIIDKGLIDDFSERRKQRQKDKKPSIGTTRNSLSRKATVLSKRGSPKTSSSSTRSVTRRIRSSSSSLSTGAEGSRVQIKKFPVDNLESTTDVQHSSVDYDLKRLNRAAAYGLRPIRTQQYALNQQRTHEEEEQQQEQNEDMETEEEKKSKDDDSITLLDEDSSLQNLLWQNKPQESLTTPPSSSNITRTTTTITEVTDDNNVTVTIRELNETGQTAATSLSSFQQPPRRFLGYGINGRGGMRRH